MLNFALLQQMQTASQSFQMQANQQQLQNSQLLAGLQSSQQQQQQQQSMLLPQLPLSQQQQQQQILIPNLQLSAQMSSSSPSPLTNFSSPLGLTPNLTNSQSQMCFGSFSLTAPTTSSQQTIPMSSSLSKSDELLQLQISQLVKEREFQTQQDNQQTLIIDALLAQLKSQQQQQQQFQSTQQPQQSVVTPFQLQPFQRQPLQVATSETTPNQMFPATCNLFSSSSASIENFLLQHQKTEQQQQFLFSQPTFQFPFQSPSTSQQQQQQLQQPPQQSSLTNNMNGNNSTTINNNTSPLFQFQSSLQQMQTTLQSLSSLSSIQSFSPFMQQQQSQQLLPSINTMPFCSNLTLNPNKRASIDSMESSSPIEKRRRLIIDDHQSETAIRSASLIKHQQLQKQQPTQQLTPLTLKKCQSDNQHNHHSHHGTHKHMNSSQSSSVRSRSRFHNLTKLFLNSLLSIFTKENMDVSNLDAQTQESISQLISKVKLTGRKTQGKVCKTDLFNHSHYNALFLTLTPESLKELASKSKDAAVHKACFDIDVSQHIEQSLLDQINNIKQKIFEVTLKVLGNPIESESVKDEYWLRAMVGIKLLNEGKLIYRFQSISEKTSNVEEDNKKDKENKGKILEETQKDTLIKQETVIESLNDKKTPEFEGKLNNTTSINLKNTSIPEQLNLVNQQLITTDIIQEDSPMKQLDVVSASSSPSSRSQTSPSSSVSHKISINSNSNSNSSSSSQVQNNPAHLQLQSVVQEEEKQQEEHE